MVEYLWFSVYEKTRNSVFYVALCNVDCLYCKWDSYAHIDRSYNGIRIPKAILKIRKEEET